MRALPGAVAEAVLVAVGAALVGLVANALSPVGLSLGRDYFPKASAAPPAAEPLAASPKTARGGASAPIDRGAAVRRRLEQRGLRVIAGPEVVGWFGEAQGAQGLTVFIDARNEAQFASGHIPGAWPFDHYRPQLHLPAVLPVCLAALRVVVYCAGGECEDSEFAAVMLRESGVPAANLFVYPGGMTDWVARGQPVEIGPRGSGRYREKPR
jgi:rhodanese-related sulfurtransferase